MKMNLPNKLSVLRLCLVPVIIIVGMLPESILPFYISCIICAVLFIGTSITDMLDGKIARKYNLITDFGKFLDPVADKFMVIGAMFVILYKFANLRTIMIFALIVVVFRELAVTSIRLVAASGKEKVVIAANMLGKIKTVTQIVAIVAAIIEPLIYSSLSLDVQLLGFPPVTLVTTALMIYLTIHSGINYIVGAWKYLDPQK